MSKRTFDKWTRMAHAKHRGVPLDLIEEHNEAVNEIQRWNDAFDEANKKFAEQKAEIARMSSLYDELQSNRDAIAEESAKFQNEVTRLNNIIEHFCDTCSKHDRNDIYNQPMTI